MVSRLWQSLSMETALRPVRMTEQYVFGMYMRRNLLKTQGESYQCSSEGVTDIINLRPDYIRLPMHESGWIRDKKGDLLLWIPPSYRQDFTLSVPSSKVFGPAHVTELDFTDFKYGEDWTQCRDSSSRTS